MVSVISRSVFWASTLLATVAGCGHGETEAGSDPVALTIAEAPPRTSFDALEQHAAAPVLVTPVATPCDPLRRIAQVAPPAPQIELGLLRELPLRPARISHVQPYVAYRCD